MAKQKEEKTNVMRLLDQKKIPYKPHTYPHGGDEAPDGETVARALGQNPAAVYKTLVTKGASGGHYVFDIPVAASLDLKKAARAVGEKSIAMLPSKELPSGDEKAVSYGVPRKLSRPGHHLRVRREGGLPGGGAPGGPHRPGGG